MSAGVKITRKPSNPVIKSLYNHKSATADENAVGSRPADSAKSSQRSRDPKTNTLELLSSLNRLLKTDSNYESALKIIPDCVRSIDSKTPKSTVEVLFNALESCALETKPQVKELCSNSMFNLGLRIKPAANYLKCWEKSLFWDTELDSDGLLLKCARYLVALIEVPEASCAGLDAAFSRLEHSLSTRHWEDPLPESGAWPKIKVAINKLSAARNLGQVFRLCNIECLAIVMRAILPYKPDEAQVRSIIAVALKRLELQGDSDTKAQWNIMSAQLLGVRTNDLKRLVHSDDVSAKQRLEVLETLVAMREKVESLDELAQKILSKVPQHDQPSLDLCNLLCLDVDDRPIGNTEANQLNSLFQKFSIKKLKALCESKDVVSSSGCTLAVVDNFIQQGNIALAISILQREAVILRGRLLISPTASTGRVSTGTCLSQLGLLYLFLETNVRLFFLFIRSGDLVSARLFLREARTQAQNFHLTTMTTRLSMMAEVQFCVNDLEKLRAYAPKSIRDLAERCFPLEERAASILTKIKQLKRDRTSSFFLDAVSVITEKPFERPASPRGKLLIELKSTLESIWRQNADIPAYNSSLISGQRYASLCAESSLLGLGADPLLMLKMLDLGKLNALRSWQKAHDTRLVARMPLEDILSSKASRCSDWDISQLPQDKTIVCIDFIRKDELLLTRIDANQITISLRLPLSRMASITGVMVPNVQDFLSKLRHCIKKVRDHAAAPAPTPSEAESSYTEPGSETDDRSTILSSSGSQTSQGVIDSKRWWRRQLELDKGLAKHLEIIESLWLGGFRAIFDTSLANDEEMAHLVLSKLQELLEQYIKPTRASKQEVNWQAFKLDSVFVPMMASLDAQLSDSISLRAAAFEDIVGSIVDQWYLQGLPLIYEDVRMDELAEAVAQIIRRYADSKTPNIEETTAKGSLVLILDAKSLGIPWESLSCVPVGTTRATSLAHLVELESARRNERATRAKSDVVYLLNPDGGLPRTQREFEPGFRLQNWKGWAGHQAESNEVLVKQLERSSCYIYLGHNAGDLFVRPSLVRRLKDAPSALLLGCSSAQVSLADNDELYDISGPICDWWAAKSPLVVGLLWDVPDKDLNRFTKEFLSRYFDDNTSAGEAIGFARKQCLLPHTTGAAPVVYGLI